MRDQKKNKVVELTITDLSKKGNGLGSAILQEGMSPQLVEVPFIIPGDKVKAMLLSKQKGVYRSLLEEIVEPSPERIPPKCIHFGSCGGCRWQQISYEK